MNTSQDISLDVPVHYQPEGSIECSVASVKMLLDYWGDDVPYNALVTSLSEWINENERHLEGVGIYLLNRGYDVWFVHRAPGVVNEPLENTTESDKQKLIAERDAIPEEKQGGFRWKKLSLGIAYIEAGGHYTITIPTLDLLDSYLERGMPAIICLKVAILISDPTRTNNHSVVVAGKEGDHYIINDPGSQFTSPYTLHKDRLLMAWYGCGAYLLAASLKESPA